MKVYRRKKEKGGKNYDDLMRGEKPDYKRLGGEKIQEDRVVFQKQTN